MSERELREASKRLFYACMILSQRSVEAMLAVNKALADDPDVVKVGLRAMERARECEQRADRVIRDTLEESYLMGMAKAFDEMSEWASATFHVRLTDDGWQWTDGGEE
jgi:hypothetical protein